MISSILKELNQRKAFCENKPIETIYFGGGTPSLLVRDELERILTAVYRTYTVVQNPEVTLEVNPDDCTEKNVRNWKELGMNRLSIGIQSFKSEDLKWMNRAHTVQEAKECVEMAQRIGFENITVDLMYGLPDLSEKEWVDHIETVIKWGVPHVSSYCLTVEKNTLLERKVNLGELKVANDEEQSRQFVLLLETLEKNGIFQYEISNFSKPGFESKHNSNYWKGVSYIGIGPSAHSYHKNLRQWNIANNAQYMKALENDEKYFENETLSPKDQFNELLLTGLRTVNGVSVEDLAHILPLSEHFQFKVDEFITHAWMVVNDSSLILTKEGRLRADYIASELFVS